MVAEENFLSSSWVKLVRKDTALVEGWRLFVYTYAEPIHLPMLGPLPSENVIYTCVTE